MARDLEVLVRVLERAYDELADDVRGIIHSVSRLARIWRVQPPSPRTLAE